MPIDLQNSKPIVKNEFGGLQLTGEFDFGNSEPSKQFSKELPKENPKVQDSPFVKSQVDAMQGVPEQTKAVLRTIPESTFRNERAFSKALLLPTFSALDSIRGMAAAEYGKQAGFWNNLMEGAKKGVLEPENTPSLGASLIQAHPKLSWEEAGAIGTVAEIGVAAPDLLTGFIEKATGSFDLEKNGQMNAAINRWRQTPQWSKAVKDISVQHNVSEAEADRGIAATIWNNRDKANYWKLLGQNIERSSGMRILSNERGSVDFSPPEPEKITNAVIKANGQEFDAPHHEAAIDAAFKAGALTKEEYDKFDREKKGMFRTSTGRLITSRAQAKKEFGITHSEQIPNQKPRSVANQPYKEAPDKFIQARVKQLQGQSDSYLQQIDQLEKEKSVREKNSMPTTAIDNQQKKLANQFYSVDSQIGELMIDRPKLNAMRQDFVQMKVNDILKMQETAEAKGISQGTSEGKEIGSKRVFEKMTEERAIQRMNESLRNSMNEEIKSMVKDIAKTDTENLPIEYKKKLDEIKENFDFSKRTDKTLARRDSMKAFVDKEKAAGNEIKIPQEYMDLLDTKTLGEMSMGDLRAVHDTIMQIYHQGKLKDKLLAVQEQRRISDIVDQAVKVITQGEGLTGKSTFELEMIKRDKSLLELPKNSFRTLIQENLRPELLLNMMDNYDENGPMTMYIWNSLNEARNSELKASDESLKELDDILKPLLKPETRIKTFKVGRFNKMTKSEALFIYANSFNEYNLDHLYGSGLSDKDIEEVTNFLSPEEKAVVQQLFDYFDNVQYPRVNKVYEAVEGQTLHKAANYFPIQGLEPVQEMLDLSKKRYGRRAALQKGFTKERVGGEAAFKKFDFLEALYKNHSKVEHYIAFEKAIRDANKILLKPEIKDAITQKYGDKMYEILQKWTKDVALDTTDYSNELMDRVSKWSRSRFALSIFGFNLSVVLKQPVGLLQGAQMGGKTETLKAMYTFLRHPIESTKFVNEKSAIMKYRGMRQEREFVELMKERPVEQRLAGVSKGLSKLQEFSLLPVQITDKYTAAVVWMGSFENSLKSGMNEKDSIAEADRVVRRTQPMGDLIDLPNVFRGPELQKQFSFAQGHVNKFFNLQFEMLSRKKRGVDSNGRFLNNLVFYTLLPAVAIATITKKRLPKDWQEVVEAFGEQATQGFIPVSMLFRIMTGKNFRGNTALEVFGNDLARIAKSKKTETKAKATLELVTELIGLPAIEFKRAMKAIETGDFSQLAGQGDEKPKRGGARMAQKNPLKEAMENLFG